MKMDLSKLTQQDLMDLKVQIDQRMVELDQERRTVALEEMKAIAAKHNLDFSELAQLATPAKKSAGPAKAKYRDSDNPQNTWAGRGRKPRWLVAALENGRNLEDFAI